MPSRVTPPGKLPRWMAALFPHLKGVESNPLYLRLSGQAFCKRPGWFRRRTPPELRFPRGAWFGRVGCFPLILLTIAPPVGAALVLLGLFGWGGGGVDVVRNFIVNGGAEPWGEGLALSLLTPAEIDAALFAVALPRELRRAAWIVPTLFAVAAMAWVNLAGGPRDGARALGALASALVWACFAFSELVAFGALGIALQLETMPHYGIGGLERIIRGVRNWVLAGLVHLPAAGVAIFGTETKISSHAVVFFGGLAIAVLLGQVFLILLARDGLQKLAGNAAREMLRRIRERHEAG